MSMRRVVIGLLLVGATTAGAQATDTTRAPEDSLLQRARQLVLDGKAEGRRIIDSVLQAVPPESAQYADALYLRATLASTAADAERDYRRLLIEAPLSSRAEDALLQLAQLEQARGDRDGATEHLRRFMLTYANHPARPRVAVQLVRLLFEQGPQHVTRACEALRSGRDEIPADNAELRNQLEFYAPRCATALAAAPPVTDSQPDTRAVADSEPAAPKPDSAKRGTRPVRRAAADSAKRTTRPTRTAAADSAKPRAATTSTKQTTRPARSASTDSVRGDSTPTRRAATKAATPAPATGFYSVQVAAYDARDPAARMVELLKARGVNARVDGTEKPFRVRVGRYKTLAAATKAAATLKSQGFAGFVARVKP